MREIKFRAKRTENEEWIFGSFLHNYKDWASVIATKSEVKQIYPETVCQFTGLTDKNGVEIYEGDIVKVDIFTKNYCIVFGESKKWGASFQYKSDYSIYYLTENFAKDCQVVGNIFDNPELI